MPTSSITAPIVLSASAAKALCDAYEKGIAEEQRHRADSPDRGDSLPSEKSKELDRILANLKS